ncbi:hypothetical protein PVK06_039585 [Gossypium arboreum]|uniref:Cyclin N-terminal domain-containing protein n=1 Tax=Gossypium arboreum TaxID=29729 RepID=A0ABR0N3A1_GOSAR|nr:hypothetical protein PVK06_039585 [Gossypium arboreum]
MAETLQFFYPFLLLEQDLFWEDEACREAMEWMLKVNAHYGFTTLITMLFVNYLDRFLSSFCFQIDKPLVIHLVAITCLSLVPKVEETHVPFLLDLQGFEL